MKRHSGGKTHTRTSPLPPEEEPPPPPREQSHGCSRRDEGRAESTWVVVEYDVQEVLVSPGDVVLVLLVKRVQQLLPGQASRDHAVLKYQRCLAADSSRAAPAVITGITSSKQHLHLQLPVAISRQLRRRRAAKLSSEGAGLRRNQKS